MGAITSNPTIEKSEHPQGMDIREGDSLSAWGKECPTSTMGANCVVLRGARTGAGHGNERNFDIGRQTAD